MAGLIKGPHTKAGVGDVGVGGSQGEEEEGPRYCAVLLLDVGQVKNSCLQIAEEGVGSNYE